VDDQKKTVKLLEEIKTFKIAGLQVSRDILIELRKLNKKMGETKSQA